MWAYEDEYALNALYVLGFRALESPCIWIWNLKFLGLRKS